MKRPGQCIMHRLSADEASLAATYAVGKIHSCVKRADVWCTIRALRAEAVYLREWMRTQMAETRKLVSTKRQWYWHIMCDDTAAKFKDRLRWCEYSTQFTWPNAYDVRLANITHFSHSTGGANKRQWPWLCHYNMCVCKLKSLKLCGNRRTYITFGGHEHQLITTAMSSIFPKKERQHNRKPICTYCRRHFIRGRCKC